MDALRAAAPLARSLLALAEAADDGELALGATVRMRVVQGRVVAIDGIDGELLGDLLRAHGALTPLAQGSIGAGRARIGARLIALGATSGVAVERALRTQLVRRLLIILRQPAPALTWRKVQRPLARPTSFSVGLAASVWSALLVIADELPREALGALAGGDALSLSAIGCVRVATLARALHEGELASGLAALGRLELAPRPPELAGSRLLATAPPASLQPLRACLRALGMAAQRAGSRSEVPGCALLLRKRRELARKVGARALLDLPVACAPDEARSALRRLAKQLHPDRFERADPWIRRLCDETLGALSHAAHALRTAP